MTVSMRALLVWQTLLVGIVGGTDRVLLVGEQHQQQQQQQQEQQQTLSKSLDDESLMIPMETDATASRTTEAMIPSAPEEKEEEMSTPSSLLPVDDPFDGSTHDNRHRRHLLRQDTSSAYDNTDRSNWILCDVFNQRFCHDGNAGLVCWLVNKVFCQIRVVYIESDKATSFRSRPRTWDVFQVIELALPTETCRCTAECLDIDSSLHLYTGWNEGFRNPPVARDPGWSCASAGNSRIQTCTITNDQDAAPCVAAVYTAESDSNHEPCDITCTVGPA